MSRDHALDATRTFAIWMMVACHVARLINKKGFQFGNTQETYSNLRKTFARLDVDSSKSLSKEEFGALFPNETQETITSLFATCDTSQSALLTYKEFYYGADKVQIRPEWMQFSLDIEPLCQALFMSMVGISLLYSQNYAIKKHAQLNPDEPMGNKWRDKQLKRAAELYGIGFLFFIFQYGIQWPWMFIGHGILLSISSAIILCLPLVKSPKWTYVAMVGLWGLAFTCNIYDIKIAYLNAGNGPFLPHVLLSVFGLIAGGVLISEHRKTKLLFLGTMTAFAVVSLLVMDFMDYFDYPTPLSEPYGRRDYAATYQSAGSNGLEQIWTMIQGGSLKASVKEYYNYTATSVPLLMAMCTAIYVIFRAMGALTAKLSPLWIVGRHSLGVYILHLILIALTTVVFGSMRPFDNSIEIHACFFVVLLICYGYSFVKEKK